MASGHLSLLCDSYQVYGLGTVLDSYDLEQEDIYTLQFTKQFVWELRHAGHLLMQVRYGEPGIHVPGFPAKKFRDDVARVFPGLSDSAADYLCKLSSCAASQRHGCMMVISSVAAQEAARLASQCTRVKPFRLDESTIPLLTAIDGSVLIDTDGTCHAIGVILDGMASPLCTPARGARYNSAIRYVFGRRDAMAVVKSEDGMISVFPDLKPQIRKSEIRSAFEELRKIANKLPIDTQALWDAMTWFHNNEFYLTAAECDEVNRLHQEARDKIPDGTTYSYIPKPLAPNVEMNESYYIDD
jgi:hypothetical protein